MHYIQLASLAVPPLVLSRPAPGQLILQDYAHVTEPDIVATNGVIHRISALLQPPPSLLEVALACGGGGAAVPPPLAHVGTYSAFAELLQIAGGARALIALSALFSQTVSILHSA
jgi:hypothetical protein